MPNTEQKPASDVIFSADRNVRSAAYIALIKVESLTFEGIQICVEEGYPLIPEKLTGADPEKIEALTALLSIQTNNYSLPGGGANKEESSMADIDERMRFTLSREVCEELSLDINPNSLYLLAVDMIQNPLRRHEKQLTYLYLSFYQPEEHGDLEPKDEIKSIRWESIDTIGNKDLKLRMAFYYVLLHFSKLLQTEIPDNILEKLELPKEIILRLNPSQH